MKNIRLISSTIFCVSVFALSACGGEAAPTTDAAATPSATAASASASASAPAAPAGAAASDKEICDAAVKGAGTVREKLLAAFSAQGDVSNEALRAAMTAMVTELSVAKGGDSEVAKAAQNAVTEIGKAAAAADPTEGASTDAFQNAGTALDTACKTVGVDINFS